MGGPVGENGGLAMDREVREIEVEIVGEDAEAPIVSRAEAEDGGGGRRDDEWREWRHWQGRAKTLDLRWWPLWVVLGTIAVFLLLTLGLVIAVVYGVLKLVGRVLRMLAR